VSFILDALRKSETDRQRDSVPGFSTIPTAEPKAAVPAWTWIVIGALAVTVVGLGGAWWQSNRVAPDDAVAVTPGLPDTVPENVAGRSPQPASTGSATVDTPTSAAVAAVAADTGAASESGTTHLTQPAVAPERESVAAAPARSSTTLPATVGALAETGAGRSATLRDTNESLPTLAQIVADGVPVPDLRLELHVYHPDPASRMVYINGGRYREGQRLPDGPTVAEIRPEGAVLDLAGRRFLLLAQ
jgi:general secretion pathway protein B